MEEDCFDYLVTSDKNLQYQQNLEKYSISFIVLSVSSNNYEMILPIIEEIKLVLLNEVKTKLNRHPAIISIATAGFQNKP